MSRLEDERAWLVEVALVVGLVVGTIGGLLIAVTSVPVLPLVVAGLAIWLLGTAIILVTAG
jgi:ABC-type xylose transport system permease subunit